MFTYVDTDRSKPVIVLIFHISQVVELRYKYGNLIGTRLYNIY